MGASTSKESTGATQRDRNFRDDEDESQTTGESSRHNPLEDQRKKEYDKLEDIRDVIEDEPSLVATHDTIRSLIAKCEKFPSTTENSYLTPHIESFMITCKLVQHKDSSTYIQKLEGVASKSRLYAAIKSFSENTKLRKEVTGEKTISIHEEKLREYPKRITYFEKRGMSHEDAYSCAFALSFHTGFKHVAEGKALVCNGINLDHESDKHYSVIEHYMLKAINAIPYYWGSCIRTLDLKADEQKFYQEGSIIRWNNFNAAGKGDRPGSDFSGRDTYFHIWSLTGRDITQFSNFPQEEEILFPPGATFLVVKKKNPSFWDKKTHIYLRQVELGHSENPLLWIDDCVFHNTAENKLILEAASTRGIGNNIHLIPKISTEEAEKFLDSEFGKAIKFSTTLKIMTDMNRPDEKNGKFAGAILLKKIREKGFTQKVLVYTMNKPNAITAIKAYCRDEEMAKPYAVCVYREEAVKFLIEENENPNNLHLYNQGNNVTI